jgi:hypothetical protein
VALGPGLIGVMLLMLSAVLLFPGTRLLPLRRVLVSLLILLTVARFCLPISSLANAYLERHFFEPAVEEAREALALGIGELDTLMDVSLPEFEGFRGTINNSVAFVKTKSVAFRDGLASVVTNAGDLVENLLRLTFLYVGVFLVQVILLPITVIWLLIRLADLLFRPRRERPESG